jgi:hypothetical protein
VVKTRNMLNIRVIYDILSEHPFFSKTKLCEHKMIVGLFCMLFKVFLKNI